MGYRTLTRVQYLAEMCLATCNLLGALIIWIALALDLPPLIYIGIGLFALDLLALLFHLNERDVGRLQLLGYAIAVLQVQFLLGLAAFAALNWPYVAESYQLILAADPEQRLMLLIEYGAPILRYGLFGVLWCKTLIALVFGVFMPLARLLDYETGRTRPWVSSARAQFGARPLP